MKPTTLSKRITYLKECAGSSRRLDKAAGLPFGHCHALTGRIDDPHLSTLHKIADGAGVPRAWVTNGDGPQPPAAGIRDAVARACADAVPDDEPEAAAPKPAPNPYHTSDPADPAPPGGTPEWSAWSEREQARQSAVYDPDEDVYGDLDDPRPSQAA